jgi:hypothetical protein
VAATNGTWFAAISTGVTSRDLSSDIYGTHERRSLHSQESLEEDDSFLSVGSETWDYEVADGREDDSIAALKNSQMVMECVRLDEEPSRTV